jgi:imidazolonepropionase
VSALLLRGIGRLVPISSEPIESAGLVAVDGVVRWIGRERDLVTANVPRSASVFDAGGRCVVPGFVDPHTHLAFGGARREDFAARLSGVPYDGGGIATTVAATRAASITELTALALARVEAAVREGTTTIEVKSGYGLDHDEEMRLLNVIARVAESTPARVEATYLGAHVVPSGRARADYVNEVIASCADGRRHGARWVDVFCDEGAFDVAEARAILDAGRVAGLGLRIHASQIASIGAPELAAEMSCASADHLDHVADREAEAMYAAGVVGVLIPTISALSGSDPRHMHATLRAAGVEIALASDCNPGSSWCESMPTAIRLACLLMGFSVEEALRAATLGSAHSLRRNDIGHLSVGAHADIAMLDYGHELDLVAHMGSRAVAATFIDGVAV